MKTRTLICVDCSAPREVSVKATAAVRCVACQKRRDNQLENQWRVKNRNQKDCFTDCPPPKPKPHPRRLNVFQYGDYETYNRIRQQLAQQMEAQ